VQGLNTRLIYRTMMVLAVIAARPGLSNIQVAAGAGVADPGQISKLLRRLERIGLLANAGKGQPKGLANAWQLTPRGRRVQSAIAREVAATWPSEGSDA
jgi:hypothetical protein